MNKKRIFSGIKPSGDLHIGNYIGAIKQWVDIQKQGECFFCIVDLHAITVPQDPQILKKRTKDVLALYIACGIDPGKSTIFIQSDNPDHCVLAWILDCVASVGQLKRMTQYKSKSKKQKSRASMGLLNYPALMAADILLYNTDIVPVGDDQRQHVELTRDLARRFNARFGETFKIPEVQLLKVGARIMSLEDANSKMSKSNPGGEVKLLDRPEIIRKKIMSAVTDSGKEILFRKDKPEISNLLTIYSHLADTPIKDLEEKYSNSGYGDFKKDLAEVVVNFLEPIQKKYYKIRQDKDYLEKVLESGLVKAQAISNKILRNVYNKVGLGFN